MARILAVPVATLRTWEDRYGQVVPERNASGHRLTAREQIGAAEVRAGADGGGASAADAHRLLAERTDGGLPLTETPPEPAPRLLILLAESDPYAAEFQEYFLKTEGFEVEVALGEEAAREAFDAASPSGRDLRCSSRAARAWTCAVLQAADGVAVIAVSALDAPDQAMEAGADAFLLKPLDPLQLVSTVRDLLRSSAFLAR